MVQTKVHRSVPKREKNSVSFAYGLGFYKLCWIFIVGSVIGYVVEMLWCYVHNGYFESRQGLLYGPFSPVYGLGALLFTLALYRIRHWNSILIFLACAVLGGTFEYLCSLFQELIFGTISWEYSQSALNLHGRTNVSYSIFWGLLGLVFIKHTLPALNRWIEKIPNPAGTGLWVSRVFIFLMVLNILLSGAAVKRQSMRREGAPPSNAFARFLDEHYTDEYLKKVYPNMQAADSKS